jgi:hypothetical protein
VQLSLAEAMKAKRSEWVSLKSGAVRALGCKAQQPVQSQNPQR